MRNRGIEGVKPVFISHFVQRNKSILRERRGKNFVKKKKSGGEEGGVTWLRISFNKFVYTSS